MKKGAVLLFLLLCIGCSQKQKQPVVRIKLVNNDQSVMFKGLDYAIISEINRDSVADIWERLLPVYKMPADTDMKNYQPLQPGKYLLKDSAVVFTPDTPFVKTQHYFIRYYQFGNGITAEDFITGKKVSGRTPYIDFAW
jgi:hypothetical protein